MLSLLSTIFSGSDLLLSMFMMVTIVQSQRILKEMRQTRKEVERDAE